MARRAGRRKCRRARTATDTAPPASRWNISPSSSKTARGRRAPCRARRGVDLLPAGETEIGELERKHLIAEAERGSVIDQRLQFVEVSLLHHRPHLGAL